jgi:hypothetical protein
MKNAVDRDGFRALFADRAIAFTRLPAGRERDLAAQANEATGRGDGSLHTTAELDVLFAQLLAGSHESAPLRLIGPDGRPTAAGTAVESYSSVALTKEAFFAAPMYLVQVSGWPEDAPTLKGPVDAPAGAQLSLWPIDQDDQRVAPAPDRAGVLFTTSSFALANTGNRTLDVPKRSWRANLTAGKAERFVGMSRLNLKAMYNDPSQMREALAWRLFARAGVPASRHGYARLTINGRYRGLYSIIEDVDRRYLRDRFGDNDRGNLYKAGCGHLGCATLERRTGPDGDDSGRQYRTRGDEPTYDLRTNTDDPAANGFEDLAALIRAIDGTGLPGGDARLTTDAFRDGLQEIFNVHAFLRWAGVNILLGSWDNYFATPSNYFLYNSGRRGAAHDVADSPYFTFLPWDYDNSFGIDYFDTAWQYTDLVDWPSNTVNYCRENHAPHRTSRIPLVANLLRNPDLVRYYLDHVEYLLDTDVNPEAITAAIGPDGGGLWDRVRQSAYLESDTPQGSSHTGRQFSNDEIYLANAKQNELHRPDMTIQAITHYVRMRYDRARQQLAALRREHPRGASGAHFPVVMEPLPGRV